MSFTGQGKPNDARKKKIFSGPQMEYYSSLSVVWVNKIWLKGLQIV